MSDKDLSKYEKKAIEFRINQIRDEIDELSVEMNFLIKRVVGMVEVKSTKIVKVQECLNEFGPMTEKQIQERSGVSQSTLNRVLKGNPHLFIKTNNKERNCLWRTVKDSFGGGYYER